MENEHTAICIVGAGAAGLWAAAVCARRGHRTLVLEKTRRAGTKVLASGGSRCNLTTTLGPAETARHFGPAKNFIKPALKALTPQMVRQHFEELGVPTKTENEFDKVFPASDSARDVRDALLKDAQDAGAEFVMETAVDDIAAVERGWQVSAGTQRYTCHRLLLSTGGQSYPKSGTTGDGYSWLRRLGLRIVDPVPALVPLASKATWVSELSGISIDGELRIGDRKRRRPILFTHKGISGPAAMDLSEQVSRYGHRLATLDLLPDLDREALRARLIDAAGRPGAPALAALLPLPKRVLAAVVRQAGISEPNPRLNQVGKAERNRLVETLKALPIPISGTLGFAMAEVTSGGLALDEVDRRSMEVKRCPGLHVFGELLDLTGPIGGFSFQAAFSTASSAAKAACAALDPQS